MGIKSHSVHNNNNVLILAILRILRPVVRLLLRHGFSFAEFAEIARRAFVDVAYSDFTIETRKQTVSRVAVLTGLSRKEVVRLRLAAEAGPLPEKGPLNRAARVISGWTTDPEFRDERGEALLLPLYGETASIAALVKRYSGDITAGAVLDELLRVGAVEWRDNRVHLCAHAYVPQLSEVEKVRIMGICGANFLNTVEHNLQHIGADSRLQRAVIYHDLPRPVVDEFKRLSAERSGALLAELNQWLDEHKRRLGAAPPPLPRYRVGLGLYYFEDVTTEDNNNEKK